MTGKSAIDPRHKREGLKKYWRLNGSFIFHHLLLGCKVLDHRILRAQGDQLGWPMIACKEREIDIISS